MTPKTPQFSLPFRFTADDAETVEQHSDKEVWDNIEMAMRYKLGDRIDDPEFGHDGDFNFQENGVDLNALLRDIERSEPRALVVIERDPAALDQLIDEILLRRPNGV